MAGYYDPLIVLLDGAVRESFVSEDSRRLMVVADTPAALLQTLRAHRPPTGPEWITPDETRSGPGPGGNRTALAPGP